MPKTEIDYSNTIIYKITCKDPDIKDVYVGHTTNFVQRKHAHKQNCNNPKSSNYACKLYNTIREKGGWTNWHMEILNFFNCFDHFEARQKEQEYFISLNANLNTIQPMPKPKEKEDEEENIVIKETQIDNTQKQRICSSCGKTYSCKQSLYIHKKNCKGTLDTQTTDSKLIFELLKQNQDFKELLLEQHNKLHRPERKMRQNKEISHYIFFILKNI